MTEQYQCQSYYDEENVLRDCSCGKCGLDSLNAPTHHNEVEGLVDAVVKKIEYEIQINHGWKEDDTGFAGFTTDGKKLISSIITTHSAKEYERGKREGTYHAWMDAIELSDKLEESNTKFDEWRAFKGFRNALHDKIATLTHKA